MRTEHEANEALARTARKPAAHMPTRAEAARHAARMQARKPAPVGIFARIFAR